MSDVTFVVEYVIFVMFLIFMVSLGAPQILPADVAKEIAEALEPENIGEIEAPEAEAAEPTAWYSKVWQGVTDIFKSVFGMLNWVFDQLHVFYILMTANSVHVWIKSIIFIPILVGLFYVVMKLLRGGG